MRYFETRADAENIRKFERAAKLLHFGQMIFRLKFVKSF